MNSLQTQQILSQQKQLQYFSVNRQKKFQQSLQAYLNHIEKETQQLQSAQLHAENRNKNISEIFEGVYERIMMGSQVLVRKVKETSYQKKIFWENLIATNADMTDIQLKKDFYQQKRDAQDRYYQSIQTQKTKKISYSQLLGKIKSDHSLKHWQQNNKNFEQKVAKGTKTLHQWKMFDNPAMQQKHIDDSYNFIQQFTQPETGEWTRPVAASRYDSKIEDNSVLKDFYHRKM